METAFGVQLREDAVLAQALAALVTAFTSRVDELLVGDREQLLALLPHAGFLLHLESLLSTAGNEIGMLEDLVIAFHLLSKVVIVLRDEDDDGPGDDPASDGTSPATPSPGASAFHARRGVGTPLAAGSPSVPHAEPTPHFGLPGTHTGASDTESGEDEDDPRLHMLLTLRHLHRLRIYSGSQYEAIRGQVQYVTAEGSPAPATPAAAASRTPQRTPHAAGGSVDDSAAVQGTHTASRSAASRPAVRRVQSARAVSAPSAGSRPAAIAAALGGTKPGGAGVPTPASPARRPTPNFVVELVLPHRLLLSLPEELRRCAVPVVPIMFTQGINEMQTIANAISESGLQHAINEHSLSMLRGFVRKWGNLQAGQNRRRVERKLKTLEEAVRMEGLASGKHYGVLTLSSDIVRELHGARLTCCKVSPRRSRRLFVLRWCVARTDAAASSHRVGKTAQLCLSRLNRHGSSPTITAWLAPSSVPLPTSCVDMVRDQHAVFAIATRVYPCVVLTMFGSHGRRAPRGVPEEYRQAPLRVQRTAGEAAAVGVPPSCPHDIVERIYISNTPCSSRE